MGASKKVFLTGGTGLIGEKLALALAEAGTTVHALVRNEKKAEKLNHPQIKLFLGDLHDQEAIQRGLEGCEEVYHLAAFAQAWAPDPHAFDRINYQAARELLDLAKETGVRKVVVTSTGGVIGHSRPGTVNDESQHGEEWLMTAYERSKKKLEAAVGEYVENGFPIVIVNPTRVYGPGPLTDSNGEVKAMHLYLQGKLRFLPGDGSSTGSYAFIDDVVRGHLLAMEKGRPGERYILGGENASFQEFFGLIGKISGKKYRMYPVPLPLLLGFSKVQLWMAERFGRYPLLTPELVRKYGKNWDFSTQKAQQELGYTYRSLEEGLAQTYDWMKKEQLI